MRGPHQPVQLRVEPREGGPGQRARHAQGLLLRQPAAGCANRRSPAHAPLPWLLPVSDCIKFVPCKPGSHASRMHMSLGLNQACTVTLLLRLMHFWYPFRSHIRLRVTDKGIVFVALQAQHLAGGGAARAGACFQGAGAADDGRRAAADGALRPVCGATWRPSAAGHPAADSAALPVPQGRTPAITTDAVLGVCKGLHLCGLAGSTATCRCCRVAYCTTSLQKGPRAIGMGNGVHGTRIMAQSQVSGSITQAAAVRSCLVPLLLDTVQG